MYNQMQQMFTQAAGFARRPKVIMWAVIIIIALVALWLLPKVFSSVVADVKKNNVDKNDGSWENQMADEYYTALHSGYWKLTEDEEALYDLAKRSKGRTGFNKISSVYKASNKNSLASDLKDLLNSDEVKHFYVLLDANN